MAASVVEVHPPSRNILTQACELGSKLLLFDEDLCATNFMIRDDVMRKLVKMEPITPLIERVSSREIR
jgi:predicted ABC-class ATPase